MSALNSQPAWLQAPGQALLAVRVKVKVLTPSNVEERLEYEGLFTSTFAAVDDAHDRFQGLQRVVASPAGRKAAQP